MKKHFNRIKLIAFIGVMTMLLSACANKGKGDDTVVVLNQRQKDILAEQGLPTDYEKLTTAQKGAISAIERMLSYLEETHNEEFTFSGRYWPTGPQHIEAYCSKGMVTAYSKYSDGRIICWDSYNNLLRENEVRSIIESWFQEQYEAGTYKCYLKFYSRIDHDPENDVVYGNGIAVFPDCDQEQILEIAASFDQWAKGQDLNTQFNLVFRGYAAEDFARINEYNIEKIIDSHIDLSYASFTMNENGNTTYRGRTEKQ